eukprot:TRINITY_DN98719_c0_g1_i1.p1 TRINITY_DN98719_c0_g1~~TRINITY_DN98719_c0_g1_i1.p1  ORF type:complete len:255 (-),score=89.76 TRINITY_DN98719_c0_g1_i1:91-855(-)
MAHEEEQALEIEALQSIFEEGKEFTTISDKEFSLKLLPFPDEAEENHVGVTLHVTYTEDYPDSAPEWELEDIKGLPEEKVKALKGKIEETIESSLGMSMIYQVAETCQDYLKENNQKELSMHEQMMLRQGGGQDGNGDEEEEGDDDEEEDEEEEEWKGLTEKTLCPASERITPEAFISWKEKFDAEMIASGVLKREETKARTGRMIFQEGKTDEAQKPSGDAAKDDKSGVLVYDAALFGEDAADDLDDLDDDDD